VLVLHETITVLKDVTTSLDENGCRKFLRNFRLHFATSKEIALKMRGSNFPPIVL